MIFILDQFWIFSYFTIFDDLWGVYFYFQRAKYVLEPYNIVYQVKAKDLYFLKILK